MCLGPILTTTKAPCREQARILRRHTITIQASLVPGADQPTMLKLNKKNAVPLPRQIVIPKLCSPEWPGSTLALFIS